MARVDDINFTTIAGSSDLLPDPKVALRYHVTPRTIIRWDKDPKYAKLGFPAPVVINGRKYRRVGELESWERKHVASKASAA